MDEFALIRAIERAVRAPAPDGRVLVGIGDDAAVLRVASGRVVATTDALVEGVHFRRDLCGLRHAGWRAAAMNLSDLAAMGARPLALLAALELPPGLPAADAVAIMRGLARCGAAHGAPVVGGNLTRGPVLALTVTALGEPAGGRVLRRAGARPGDVVMAGACLGAAALGLALLDRDPAQARRHPGLVRAWRRPVPQVALGLALAADPAVHAAIDVSDGLAADLRHVLQASGTGAVVDVDRVPLHRQAAAAGRALGCDPLLSALSGGDDYVLLAAVDPAARDRWEQAGMATLGHVTARRGLRLLRDGKTFVLPGPGGWTHR